MKNMNVQPSYLRCGAIAQAVLLCLALSSNLPAWAQAKGSAATSPARVNR